VAGDTLPPTVQIDGNGYCFLETASSIPRIVGDRAVRFRAPGGIDPAALPKDELGREELEAVAKRYKTLAAKNERNEAEQRELEALAKYFPFGAANLHPDDLAGNLGPLRDRYDFLAGKPGRTDAEQVEFEALAPVAAGAAAPPPRELGPKELKAADERFKYLAARFASMRLSDAEQAEYYALAKFHPIDLAAFPRGLGPEPKWVRDERYRYLGAKGRLTAAEQAEFDALSRHLGWEAPIIRYIRGGSPE
jgi:hypothetical protein